jgi:hypothetical protein
MVAEVISEDTGLAKEQSLLLADGLLGLAQVSAQRWLRGGMKIPADEAASLLASLAWQGISEFPLSKPPMALPAVEPQSSAAKPTRRSSAGPTST